MDYLFTIFTLISPLTELYPELGMSYFIPPNKDIPFYNRVLNRRLLAVALVWIPIFLILFQKNKQIALLILFLILFSFSGRIYGQMHLDDNLSGGFYLLGFSLILYILYKNCTTPNCQLLSLLAILAILMGGSIIGKGRTNNNLSLDWLGRIIFSSGFSEFIFQLINLQFTDSNINRTDIFQTLLLGSFLFNLMTKKGKSIQQRQQGQVGGKVRQQVGGNLALNKKLQTYLTSHGKNIDDFIFCNSQKDLKHLSANNFDAKIISIPQNYLLGNRKKLWETLKHYYGINKASKLMPATYTMPDEYSQYRQTFSKKEPYVFKTGQHRQQGIYITDSLLPENMVKSEKFIVAQKYIPNCYKYKGYKTNLRLYLFIKTCGNDNKVKWHLTDNGIVSYGIKDNQKSDISSFYESKTLYDANYPIIIKDLEQQCPKFAKMKAYKKCHKLMNKVINAYDKLNLFQSNIKNQNKFAELFGVDFFITEDGNVYLIEVNINPGMKPYDMADEDLRNSVFGEFLEFVKN